LDALDNKAKSTGTSLGGVIGGVAKYGTVIAGAVTAAGSAVLGFATKAAQQSDTIDEMSQKLGLSKTAYQEWGYVLKLNGGDIESMGVGMKSMTALMEDAQAGGSKSAEIFGRLGINIADVSKMSRENAFNTVVTALQGVTDETDRASLATQVFSKAGINLMPTINMTADQLQGMKDRAHELGLVLSDEAVTAGGQFADQMEETKATLGALGAQALAPLMPMLNDLMKSFTDVLPSLMSFIEPLVQQLMPVIQTLISQLLPVFMKLFEALTPIISPLVDVFMLFVNDILIPLIDLLTPIIAEFLPPLIDLFASLIPVLKPIIELFFQILQAILPPLIDVVGKLITAAMPLIQMVLPILIDLFNMLAPILMPLIEIFMEIINLILPPITEAFNWLATNVLPLFANAFQAIQPIIQGAMNVIMNIIKTVLALIKGDWSGAWDGIKNIFSSFATYVKAIAQAFSDFFSGIWRGMKTAAVTAWESIKTLVTGIVQGIANFFTGIWNSIKLSATTIWVSISNGIRNAVDSLFTFIKGIPASVLEFFTSLPRKMFQIGKDIITGIWDGISAMISWIKDKVSGFINGIVGSIKGVLGIKSPSKVFGEIGTNIAQGMALGITDAAGAVEDATAQLSKVAEAGIKANPVNVNATGTFGQAGQVNQTGRVEHILSGTIKLDSPADENTARKIYMYIIDQLKVESSLRGLA
jgi:phage-related protein